VTYRADLQENLVLIPFSSVRISKVLSAAGIAAVAGLGVMANQASAAITVQGDYHLGEADAGAVLGGTGAAITKDSSGNGHDLTRFGSPTYTAAIAGATVSTGSTLSTTFGTAASPNTGNYYQGPTFNPTGNTNFGFEGYFTPTVTPTGEVEVVTNGSTNNGAVSLLIDGAGGGRIGVVYGGRGVAETTISAVAGVPFYFAYVNQNGACSLYVNDGITPALTFSGNPNGPSGNFTIGDNQSNAYFTGTADEVRFFTFDTDAFSTSDLLVNQTNVPEPASLGALGLAGGAILLRRRRLA
jgi:hypothetical protein